MALGDPSILPATPIDAAHGWRWVVRASDHPAAAVLARFEQLECAQEYLADLRADYTAPRLTDIGASQKAQGGSGPAPDLGSGEVRVGARPSREATDAKRGPPLTQYH